MAIGEKPATPDSLIAHLKKREEHFEAVQRKAAAEGKQAVIDVASFSIVMIRWMRKRLAANAHPLAMAGCIAICSGGMLGEFMREFMVPDQEARARGLNSVLLRFTQAAARGIGFDGVVDQIDDHMQSPGDGSPLQ